MERNVLKKRIKGLLAFMLVFMMMFGSSLTVLAADVDTYLTEGMEIPAGEKIAIPAEKVTSGGITIYVDR